MKRVQIKQGKNLRYIQYVYLWTEDTFHVAIFWLIQDLLQYLIMANSILQYISIEDPVRRRINNSLVAGASVKGQTQLAQMRGLILLPEEVDFGVLKEGNTYSFTVHLKNTGVDSCRYKLKQPPPATGLRIVYKPGPVSACSYAPESKIGV